MLGGVGAPISCPYPHLLLSTQFLEQPWSHACKRNVSWPGCWIGKVFWATSCLLVSRAAWQHLSESKQLCLKLRSFSSLPHVLFSFFPIPAFSTPPHVPMLVVTETLLQFISSVHQPGRKRTSPPPPQTKLAVMPGQPSADSAAVSKGLASCLPSSVVCCSPLTDATQYANSGEGESLGFCCCAVFLQSWGGSEQLQQVLEPLQDEQDCCYVVPWCPERFEWGWWNE